MSDCNHEVIAWRDENGKAHLWGCYQCRVKFVPITQLDAEVKAEREACAKVCEDAISSIWECHPEYVKQTGTNVCNNLAAAIRARGQA